jgi:ABC-type multidrug transport system fused ATPase/permease subunit
VLLIQACLGVLDLIGVGILGVIGALAIRGVQSQQPGDRISQFLQILNIESLSFQHQIAILGIFALFLLITKTLATVYFTRKILFFLGRKGAEISSELISKTLAQPILGVQSQTSHFIQYGIGAGVSAVALGILGTASTLVADISLIAIIGLGITIINPYIAASEMILFVVISVTLYLSTHVRVRVTGTKIATLSMESNKQLSDVLDIYREVFVRNRRYYFANGLNKIKAEISSSVAEQAFFPNISKYVIEVSVIVGSISIAAVQFLKNDAVHAAAGLSIFLASASRIAPSLLRLQQSLIQIQSNIGMAEPTLQLIEKMKFYDQLTPEKNIIDFSHSGFTPKIELVNVYFKYPESDDFVINNLSLEIPSGSFTAIVGPSGAGKSSLIDLMLGIHKPNEGNVKISDLEPEESISIWPGAIAYVPQKVGMSDSSIKANIGIGFPLDEIDEEHLKSAIQMSQLDDFISTLPDGVNTEVGERGAKLSGGQKQRIGIARALYSNPKLLILDEATSSLDGQTEAVISESISNMRGSMTLIVIAHRLSTVMKADKIVYLDSGQIVFTGTFDEVRNSVPDFDHQAQLMGL